MGLNLEIHVKVKVGTDVPLNDTQVEGEFVEVDSIDTECNVPAGATHVLSSMTRYYGAGYERGPWPQISALLLELLMDERVETIWYGNDNHHGVKFELYGLSGMNEYYVDVGHEPYCGDRRR